MLAKRQHGAVSAGQLRALGLSASGITRRAHRGQLHRVHRGVYAVGYARLTWRGVMWAAVLAVGGPGKAAISHRAAAAVHNLGPIPAGRIDVTTILTRHKTAALDVHRAKTLDAAPNGDDRLPVTTVARTLLDLADVLSPHRLERACHEAEYRQVLDLKAIDALIARSPGRATAKLRRALAPLRTVEPIVTNSGLEDRFYEVVDQAGLPRPLVNQDVEGCDVDFFWPERNLVIETDGRDAHLNPVAFEEDRRRDADLVAAGYRVVRFTKRQVIDDPAYVLARLRRLHPSTDLVA